MTQPPDPLPGARLLFSLDPSVAHLNHGSYGAVPISVQRLQQRLRDEVEENPMRFFSRGLVERIQHTRRHLAGFVGADPEGTALVPNASTGTAIVLQSLGLAPGDEVLLTDHGYGAVELAARREAKRTGALLRMAPVPVAASDAELVDAVRAAFTSRTRLLIVDHVTSPTARLMPVTRLVGLARERGIPVLVDGAHAPGMLPLEVTALGCDFWVGNLHKWAYAARGTALLYAAPPWRDRLEPLVVSWEQDSGFPARVEWQATSDYTSWLSAPAALFTLRTLGPEAVRRHNAALAAYGQRVVGAALKVASANLPDPGSAAVSMRIVPLPPGVADTAEGAAELSRRVADRLAAMVAVNACRGRGYLRLSAQVYNRPEEYERLADGLPALLR